MHKDKSIDKLKHAQKEYGRALEKLEKTRARVQRRGEALRALETKLAQLEHDAFERETAADAPARAPMQTARLIYNPNSGGNRGDESLDQVLECLRAHGIEPELTIKTSRKVICQAARRAAKHREPLVIVAGGDGTIEKIAAELVGSDTTLGILPRGSMNNLARSLGIPLELQDACALIAMGVARRIDVGHVHVKGKKHVRYFLETAGLGLNAIAFPMGQELKKGTWSTLPHALKKIVGFQPTPTQIELDDGEIVRATLQVVTISNAPLTGLNFLIAPEAKMDDGFLDVAVFDEMSKTDLLGYFMAARNGNRADNPKIKKYRARRIRVRLQDAEPVVSDKDPLPANSDLEIEIIPQALRVIVGKGIGLTFPVDAVPSVPPLAGPQTPNGHPDAAVAADSA